MRSHMHKLLSTLSEFPTDKEQAQFGRTIERKRINELARRYFK